MNENDVNIGQPQQLNVDFGQLTEVACENCGKNRFIQQFLMRKLPAVLSPTGQESYIPVPVFACASCGHINEDLIPKE